MMFFSKLMSQAMQICIFVVLFIPLFVFGTADSVKPFPNLTLITEEYPPISFADNGVVKGFAVELLALTLAHLESKQSIKEVKVMPWARAYKLAQTKPLTLIFSIAKNTQREALFQWAGSTLHAETIVISKASHQLVISNIEELKSIRLGVVRNDIAEQTLLEAGINIESLTRNIKPEFIIKMLNHDRIDAFVTSKTVAYWYFEKLRLDSAQFENVYTLEQHTEYFAFSNSTPDEIINRFQHALQIVKKSDKYQALLKRYPSIASSNVR